METKNIFCRELCTATQTVLNSLIESGRMDRATDYAILFSSNCFVTYDIGTNQGVSICIRLYKHHGVTIDIKSQSQSLIGLVNGKKEIELPLDPSTIDFMVETVYSFANFLRERNPLCTVRQTKRTYTVDLHA